MKITSARTIVVGTPWRELVFLELATDTGLVGTSEVAHGQPDGHVDRVSRRAGAASRHRHRSVRRRAARLEHPARRVRPAGRSLAVGARVVRRRVLGPHRPVARRADLEAARRQVPRARAGVRQRLVSVGTRAGDHRRPRQESRGCRLSRDQARSVRARQRGASSRRTPACGGDRRRRSATRSVRTSRSWSRCTDASRRRRPRRWRGSSSRSIRTGSKSRRRRRTRWRIAPCAAATHLPIATGERAHTMEDIRGFIEGGLVDIVQVDLTHFGGFLAMKKLAGWADAYALILAPHNVCGPVGTMANLHFAVATPNYKVLEHFNDFADSWVHELVDRLAANRSRGRLLRRARSPGSRASSSTTTRARNTRAPAGASSCSRRAGRNGRLVGGRGRRQGMTPELALDARAELGEGPTLGRPPPPAAVRRHHARPRARVRSVDEDGSRARRRRAGRRRGAHDPRRLGRRGEVTDSRGSIRTPVR